jgi:hypothetical protein
LTGNYTRYPALQLKVCPQCEHDKPHCQNCGVPLRELNREGKAILCDRCAKEVDKCFSCGEPLLKDYSFFEGNKALKYCFACIARYPRCDDCGAPSGPSGTKLDDGRNLCPECRKVALFDLGIITSIKKKVFAFVTVNMRMPVKHNIGFSLQDRNFLNQKASKIHGDLNGLFYRKGDNYDIYVLYGLREKDLLSVLAHELTHAWEAENCGDDGPLEDQEGFAQWVAYKTLINFAYSDYASLMTEGDNIYAKGLTKMLKIEQNGGAGGVFGYIKSGKISGF